MIKNYKKSGFTITEFMVVSLMLIVALVSTMPILSVSYKIYSRSQDRSDLAAMRQLIRTRISCQNTITPAILNGGASTQVIVPIGANNSPIGSLPTPETGPFNGSYKLVGNWFARFEYTQGSLLVYVAKATSSDGLYFAKDPMQPSQFYDFSHPTINPFLGVTEVNPNGRHNWGPETPPTSSFGTSSSVALCSAPHAQVALYEKRTWTFPEVEARTSWTLPRTLNPPCVYGSPSFTNFCVRGYWYSRKGYLNNLCSRLCRTSGFSSGLCVGGAMEDPVVNNGIFTGVPRTFENSTIDCDCMR